MEQEIWLPVKDYEGLYEVSSFGRVRSLDRVISKDSGIEVLFKGGIMSLQLNKCGYLKIRLVNCNHERKTFRVHRLEAIAHIPNPKNKRCVNHKDGIKTNNELSNLEWSTHSENLQHAFNTNLRNAEYQTGCLNKASKLNDESVIKIRNDYKNGNCTFMDLAKEFGVSKSNISSIINFKTWKHIR